MDLETAVLFNEKSGVLTVVATASALVLAAPALAQSQNMAGSDDSDTVPSEHSPQPTQGAARERVRTNNDRAAPAADDTGGDDAKPPSQRLPEAKSSDYGADNYNAPDDAQLDNFAAQHQTPAQNDQDGQESLNHPGAANPGNGAAAQPSDDEQDNPGGDKRTNPASDNDSPGID